MKSLFTAVGLMAIATCAQADWTLNQADSSFTFSSVKKGNVYESHTFKQYEGSIDNAGNALLTLNLGSVDTTNPVRNERIKTMLFNVVKFPTAQYSLTVDPSQLESLKLGERLQLEVDGKLSLLGISKTQAALLNIFKLGNDRVLVTTAKPIAIIAADFELGAGIDALQKAANLPSISHTAPINFSLVFDQK